MAQETLVIVDNASKRFCRSLKRSLWYGMQDILAEALPFQGRTQAGGGEADGDPSVNLRPSEFWAVKSVSFTLRRGECLGLIGRNGAGKTTLLKLLNGLIKPDWGSISMHGRVGALIALGAGFNPILTGRENIYVNASVLGLSKRQTDRKISEIIEFAEIGDFIDSPVQSYSSGMQVRLGFAIATTLDPDVLLLDEVLAVGDVAFRAKCYSRIGKLQSRSASILVSHNMEHIGSICTSVLFMHAGRAQYFRDPEMGIETYGKANEATDGEGEGTARFIMPPFQSADLQILTPDVGYGDTLRLRLSLCLSECMQQLRLSWVAWDAAAKPVAEWSTAKWPNGVGFPKGFSSWELSCGPLYLTQGKYQLGIGISPLRGSATKFVWLDKVVRFNVREEGQYSSVSYQLPSKEGDIRQVSASVS